MTAVKQVDGLRDDLVSLQETTRIAMEAMLNSHRKIEAALNNGNACSHQDRKCFMSNASAAIAPRGVSEPLSERSTGKELSD